MGEKSDFVAVGLPEGRPILRLCGAMAAAITCRIVVGVRWLSGGEDRAGCSLMCLGETWGWGGRGFGVGAPQGGDDLLSPPASESHPGAQPLHGDDGGQPEEAPRRRHPGQSQRGHRAQQRRGDQDHLLGERGRVPPSCVPLSTPLSPAWQGTAVC